MLTKSDAVESMSWAVAKKVMTKEMPIVKFSFEVLSRFFSFKEMTVAIELVCFIQAMTLMSVAMY